MVQSNNLFKRNHILKVEATLLPPQPPEVEVLDFCNKPSTNVKKLEETITNIPDVEITYPSKPKCNHIFKLESKLFPPQPLEVEVRDCLNKAAKIVKTLEEIIRDTSDIEITEPSKPVTNQIVKLDATLIPPQPLEVEVQDYFNKASK